MVVSGRRGFRDERRPRPQPPQGVISLEHCATMRGLEKEGCQMGEVAASVRISVKEGTFDVSGSESFVKEVLINWEKYGILAHIEQMIKQIVNEIAALKAEGELVDNSVRAAEDRQKQQVWDTIDKMLEMMRSVSNPNI
jgi:hypothetical protein